jgi:hypothetical protein
MADPDVLQSRRTLLLAAGLLPLPAAAAEEAAGSLLSLFGGSGDRVEGSGKVVDDERSVAGFTKVIVNGPLDVRIAAGDADHVVVHADDNIAPLVDTSVLGATLVIGLKSGASFRTRSKMQVRVQAARLQGVTLRGSGDIRVDRVDSDIFEATLQGSGDVVVDALRADTVAVSIAGNGDIRARGTAGTLGVVIDGNGDVHFADLVARTVAVAIRGSGDARVHATDELQVSINGSGDVRYRGTPKITKAISGSGSVEPLR